MGAIEEENNGGALRESLITVSINLFFTVMGWSPAIPVLSTSSKTVLYCLDFFVAFLISIARFR